MTIAELHSYSITELEAAPGDGASRFRALAPLFDHLHKNSVVFRSSPFYWIVTLDSLRLDEWGLAGTASARKSIELPYRASRYVPDKPFSFAMDWQYIRLIGRRLNAVWASFSLWPEAELVGQVEALVDAGNPEKAYELLFAD